MALSYRNGRRTYRGHRIVDQVLDVPMTNSLGDFLMAAFQIDDGAQVAEPLAVYRGLDSVPEGEAIPFRMNSACISGEVFGCERCDCAWQLHAAMERVARTGFGLVTYHPNEDGRGAGSVAKLKTYRLMNEGYSPNEAFGSIGIRPDTRSFQSAVLIVQELGVERVILMSNNPRKAAALEEAGIIIADRTPMVMPTESKHIQRYLGLMRDDLGHLI